MTGPHGRAAAEARARNWRWSRWSRPSPQSGFFHGTGQSIRDIWRYRELLGLLVRRELKVRYKDSVLGFMWTLLRPLAQLLVYAIAVGKFLGASKGHDDYPIYVFSGLTIWQLMSEIVLTGTGSMMANAGLVKKVYLPREVFPLSVVGSALFNFVHAGRDTGRRHLHRRQAADVRAPRSTPCWRWESCSSTEPRSRSCCRAVNVYLRDVQYLVEISLMWGLWTAPIVYKWQCRRTAPGRPRVVRRLYLANPVTESVLGFQRAFWAARNRRLTPSPTWPGTCRSASAVGLVLLWICQRVFARLQANFAQEL